MAEGYLAVLTLHLVGSMNDMMIESASEASRAWERL